MTKEQPTIRVGIDVSKDKLAVAIAGGGEDELTAHKGGEGEEVVDEAARLGILIADFLACVCHQQAV